MREWRNWSFRFSNKICHSMKETIFLLINYNELGLLTNTHQSRGIVWHKTCSRAYFNNENIFRTSYLGSSFCEPGPCPRVIPLFNSTEWGGVRIIQLPGSYQKLEHNLTKKNTENIYCHLTVVVRTNKHTRTRSQFRTSRRYNVQDIGSAWNTHSRAKHVTRGGEGRL